MSGTGCIEVEVQYVWACIEFDPGKVVLEANVTGIILLESLPFILLTSSCFAAVVYVPSWNKCIFYMFMFHMFYICEQFFPFDFSHPQYL
jgi:hypothetical protein